jgi:lysyl-tRNA synthetase class 2
VGPELSYQGIKIDLTLPWERVSVKDAFSTYAHVDFETFFNLESARSVAKAKGYAVSDKNSWEELYNQIFLNDVEPHLGVNGPTLIYDFPSAVAALARKKKSDPRFAERFELYIGGLEIGDCYTELTDWKEQKQRFDKEMKEIVKQGKTSYEYDHDFIAALKVGLPECSGIAIGVDRLLMLFANTRSVADVLFFPIEELL